MLRGIIQSLRAIVVIKKELSKFRIMSLKGWIFSVHSGYF
jgi:hypothetical protein